MVTYKVGLDCINWHQLNHLYDNVGLVAGYGKKKDFDKIRAAFEHSYKVVTAWKIDNLIGAARMYEAQKYNEKVTHCLCVVRDDENSPFKVLSPCGVCQERLRYWGGDVKVGVTTEDAALKFVTLKELQPYHWTGAYPKEELEHYQEIDLNHHK